MKIASSFHDYYDTVQATGQDQTLVYRRTRKEVWLDRETFPFPVFGGRFLPFYGRRLTAPFLAVVQSVIGFCGKIHLLLQLSHQRQHEPHPKTALCYSLTDVDEFVEAHFRRHHVEGYRWKPRGLRRFADRCWPMEQRREEFERLFETYASKESAFGSVFLDSGCPIFVASTWWGRRGPRDGCKRQYRIVYNECLNELEFFRVMDTYTAYQEIQMFLGNLAQPNKPIPEIPDKDMVSIKGFDKWSFRKPPE